MTDHHPELTAFSYALDAHLAAHKFRQPAPVREAFHYCLCLLMVEAGVMRLVEKVPNEAGQICVFCTTEGERFSVVEPALSRDQEAALIDVLREILKDEGKV